MTGDCFWFSVPVIFSDTRIKDFCTDACGDTADHMYGSTSGKIMEAKLRKPAAAPDPVTGDRIDDQRHYINSKL